MSNPTGYTHTFSYQGYEAAYPSTPKPGLWLDSDFASVASSISSIISAVEDVRRSDGALKNAIVTWDSLNAATKTLVTAVFNSRGTWLTATAYAVGDWVRSATTGGTYVCGVAHTSGTFDTDKSAGKWFVLSVSDDVGSYMAVPAPELADAGKALVATGAGAADWEDPGVLLATLGNGTHGAPTLSFENDSTSGFWSNAAGQINIAVSGVAVYDFLETQFQMSANRIMMGKDASPEGSAWIGSLTGTEPNNLALGFTYGTTGAIDDVWLRTQFNTWKIDSTGATLTDISTPSNYIQLFTDNAGNCDVGIFGANPGIFFGGTSDTPQWVIGLWDAGQELQFNPTAGLYQNARFGNTSGVVMFGAQTGIPSETVGGILTNNAYVQGLLYFGQGASTPSYSIAWNGDAVLRDIYSRGALVRKAGDAVAFDGGVTEAGPLAIAASATLDVPAGNVVTGIRTDGAGNIYLRYHALKV